MVESAKLKSRLSKRRDSTGDLGQVKETDEDDTVWIKISDEEMVSRYGIGAIFGGEMGEENLAAANRKRGCCKSSKRPSLADLKSDYEYSAQEIEEID